MTHSHGKIERNETIANPIHTNAPDAISTVRRTHVCVHDFDIFVIEVADGLRSFISLCSLILSDVLSLIV